MIMETPTLADSGIFVVKYLGLLISVSYWKVNQARIDNNEE